MPSATTLIQVVLGVPVQPDGGVVPCALAAGLKHTVSATAEAITAAFERLGKVMGVSVLAMDGGLRHGNGALPAKRWGGCPGGDGASYAIPVVNTE